MKYPIFFTFFIFYISAFGQKQDIEIIEERSDSEIKLYAINNTSDDLDMEVLLKLIGFTTNENFPINKIVKKGSKEYLITLLATTGVDCEYNTSVSYKKIVQSEKSENHQSGLTRTTGIRLNPDKINVFTRDGCSRCDFVIGYLELNHIPYLELNTSIHRPNLDLMFAKLAEFGFQLETVQMPVVISKNKIDYNIGDLPGFLKNLK